MVVGDSVVFYMVIRGGVLVFERGRLGKERDELRDEKEIVLSF